MDSESSVIELFKLPIEFLDFCEYQREEFVNHITKKFNNDSGSEIKVDFKTKSPITFWEEAGVIILYFFACGSPFILPAFASWLACTNWIVTICGTILIFLLSIHYIPDLTNSWITLALYKYHSLRVIYTGDTRQKIIKSRPFLIPVPPHGMVPIGSMLAAPMATHCMKRNPVGATHWTLPLIPFMRYLVSFKTVDSSKEAIVEGIKNGHAVGIIPDGIAGIFKNNEKNQEVVWKKRKGIAKLALQNGIPVVPAYCVGNTKLLSLVFDPWGLLKQFPTSWMGEGRGARGLFLYYYGRFYLPIPRRENITILLGAPIEVKQVDNPCASDIDLLHERILQQTKKMYDSYKGNLGVQDEELKFTLH